MPFTMFKGVFTQWKNGHFLRRIEKWRNENIIYLQYWKNKKNGEQFSFKKKKKNKMDNSFFVISDFGELERWIHE